MDDEDTLLPRKLQAALEQALERKNELINQDSDSDSDDGKFIWKRDLHKHTCRWYCDSLSMRKKDGTSVFKYFLYHQR